MKKFALLLVFFITGAFAQDKTDSLRSLLSSASSDTAKARINTLLANEYVRTDPEHALASAKEALRLAGKNEKLMADALFYIGLSNDYLSNYDTALAYHRKALAIREKLQDLKGIAQSCNNIGIINQLTGNMDEALKFYQRTLQVALKNHDLRNAVKAQNNIGVLREKTGEYNKAMEAYLQSLRLNEQINDKQSIGMTYLNLGHVQYELSQWNAAMKYYRQAETILREVGDVRGLASTLNNMAGIYHKFNKLDSAQLIFENVYRLQKSVNDRYGLPHALTNLGMIQFDKKNYAAALKYYEQARDLRDSIGDGQGSALMLKNIGHTYNKMGNYALAEQNFQKALTKARAMQLRPLIQDIYSNMSDMYLNKKNYFNAHQYLARYMQLKDSLYTEETGKQLEEMNARYQTEKKEKEIQLLNKDKEQQALLTAADNKRRNIILASVALGLVIVVIFSIFLYKRYRVTERQKNIIFRQKELIEEKQKEILDSIHYAKRIQRTLLTSDRYIEKNLKRLQNL